MRSATRHLHPLSRFAALAALVGFVLTACGDPAGPTVDPDVNPALLDDAGGVGGAVGGADGLPQGDAEISGPNGLLMDATAEEFIQQVTTVNGTVLQTSGFSVRAVPDESVTGAPIDRLGFFAAYTGSLDGVDFGPHTLMPRDEWPIIDFVTPNRVNGASVRFTGDSTYHYASEGSFEIARLVYDDEVRTCEVDIEVVRIDRCEYQVGTLEGTIQFQVTAEDGSVVLEETDFEVPIRRRIIVGEFIER